MMDSQTALHLSNWADATLHESERDEVLNKMIAFLYEYPELIGTRTWPEIRTLATRS